MRQVRLPTPDIPCQPGWCLQYVRQAYGLPARYASATEAWDKSATKHRDRNFPKGLWIPVWYGLDTEPAGHVVLRAPDGSVYSTSDLGTVPHHHPDLADLEAYYTYYGMTLQYRGWTEDVAGYAVIAPPAPKPAPPKGPLMALTDKEQAEILAAVREIRSNTKDINVTAGKLTLRQAVADIRTKVLKP